MKKDQKSQLYISKSLSINTPSIFYSKFIPTPPAQNKNYLFTFIYFCFLFNDLKHPSLKRHLLLPPPLLMAFIFIGTLKIAFYNPGDKKKVCPLFISHCQIKNFKNPKKVFILFYSLLLLLWQYYADKLIGLIFFFNFL